MVLAMFGILVQLLVFVGIVAAVVMAVSRKRSGTQSTISSTAPRDVFTYLLTAIALYISAAGVILIVWGLADYWFPGFDSAADLTDNIRGGISMAVVAFPIFVYLNKVARARIRSGETNPDSRLRQAFIYLNLFIAAVVVMVDLMVVIYDFLSGDLTPRFLMKAGGLVVVAVLVFSYYRTELAIEPEPTSETPPAGPVVAA
jgi:uncharacterized protein DUF5671